MTRERSGKLRYKITAGMLLLAFFPLVIYVFYAFSSTRQLTAAAIAEGQELISRTVQALQQENLDNQARLAEKEFGRVAAALSFLRAGAENIFNHPLDYLPVPDSTPIRREAPGFWWTPAGPGGASNVFVSSRLDLTGEPLNDLWRTRYLDPLFDRAVNSSSNIVAAYFIGRDSLTRIFPGLDFRKMVETGIFPADMNPYDFNFFYTADPDHNPQKRVVWTEPYLDVTERGRMVTCLAPVYLADGTFRGIVGVDVTLENITSGILNNMRFDQPGACALLIDSRGGIIAAQNRGGIPEAGAGKEDGRDYGGRSAPGPDRELLQAFEKISSGGRGMIELETGGVESILFYTPISINGWGMVSVIPVGEIEDPIRVQVQQKIATQLQAMIRRHVLTGLVIILVALSVAYLISRHITQPIYHLTCAAESLGRGETTRILVRRNDEIGILASTFNNMAVRITGLLNDLEDKVRSRTLQLEKANQRLLAVNKKIYTMEKARRTLIANISHELRGPLTSILGYVEALQDGVAQEEDTSRRYLKTIHQKAKNLNSLIDDLFLLSRLEARLPINVYACETPRLLQENVERISSDIEAAGLKVITEIEPRLPSVLADPASIGQVLGNLAANALKYTAPGGSVAFRARAREREVVVEVSDNGAGIAPEDLPHIFDRFYRGRVPPCRVAKSHGLGLAIVKEIIEAQGGRVWVKSVRGVGSSFFFTLKISDNYELRQN